MRYRSTAEVYASVVEKRSRAQERFEQESQAPVILAPITPYIGEDGRIHCGRCKAKMIFEMEETGGNRRIEAESRLTAVCPNRCR